MYYLHSFQPYLEDKHVYPWRVICPMQLEHIEFAPITIFYGNNGCGKLTLLNVIAECIGIKNKTQGNSNEYFKNYVKKCTYSGSDKMPKDSALIRSEDIMAEITKRREKALEFFRDHLFEDTLYLLDEPENSMAPAYQMELAHEIALLAYRLNSQFIIATHSPFMHSIESARIYDLDARPARIREWYELENMQTYYQLFCHFLIIIF